LVSGIREFLGQAAGKLAVTNLAKWKTALQMIAIFTLLCFGVFEHYITALSYGMGPEIFNQILAGQEQDIHGLRWKFTAANICFYGGFGLLWVAALITAITGYDYFRKASALLGASNEN